MERFFHEHGQELYRRYGAVDAATVVPAKPSRGVSRHPLDVALDRLGAKAVPPREPLLTFGPGVIDRRAPHPKGFVASTAAAGRSILVLDDVYTTGAQARSAAHALREAGAVVPAIVVVGRRLNPDVYQAIADLVERQRAAGYDFRRSPWEP